ncbi:DUF4190 domain-containing protein [Amycolatopsis sp. 195334CR]|uniref:DUF4190 domain-containing protein n=1 Tax=Amycolatopsis sp. 195334CR TaxID=2814588 RepID=UPI001A902EC9|nr:DUF4190 domain-containing protein [Amycolatopsis sp. 195334CR]MBN6036715.1 DUF4190 domain-containing protein [Amycolatopsis sp. 195334CR]
MSYPQDPYGQQQPQSYGPPSGGYPQQPYPQQPGYGYGYGQPMPMQNQDQGMAVAAMICSIVGLVACGGILSIVGLVLGHIAYAKAKRGEAGGQGMALAAIIIGWVVVGLLLIGVIILVIAGIATDWDFD